MPYQIFISYNIVSIFFFISIHILTDNTLNSSYIVQKSIYYQAFSSIDYRIYIVKRQYELKSIWCERKIKLTSHVNNSNKYKLVTIANITMNKMRIDENVFNMRTRSAAIFGKYFCMSNPIANGINRPSANVAIFSYGTMRWPRSNIDLPNVNVHKGIIAAERIFLE